MTRKIDVTRRTALRGAAAAGALAGFSPLRAALGATLLVVGFVYVGPRDDYGYNQARAEAAALKAMPDVKVLEEENVPETIAVEKTLESMINLDGATLLFPTSFGYFDPHMLKLCA
jgi:simple sugar transport system substrate-binding protein